MRIFEVSVNGKNLCRAGVGEGLLLADVAHFVRQKPTRRDSLRLDVAAVIGPPDQHLLWIDRQLTVGDVVEIRIVDGERVSKFRNTGPIDPAALEKAHQAKLESEAKRLGWKILKPKRSSRRRAPARPGRRPPPGRV